MAFSKIRISADVEGAVLNADYNAQSILQATTDDTPAVLTVGVQTVVGRLTGGNIAAIALGIADNNIVQMDQADAADDEYARFTANGLESRSVAEVNADLASFLIVSTIASSATPTPAIASQKTSYTITALTEGATFGVPSGSPADGDTLLIRVKDDGSGETLAWNAIYRSVVGTLPATTTASKTSYIGLVYNSADSKWDCLAAGEEA